MNSSGRSVGIGVLVFAGLIGLRIFAAMVRSSASGPREPEVHHRQSPQESQAMADALMASIKEMKESSHLRPIIKLPAIEGWTHGEVEPFETVEEGFAIPFEHSSGMGLTFYQFTRGHTEIPDDLSSPFAVEEFEHAKKEIEDLAGKGIAWDSAKLIKTEMIPLGDSPQQAHRALYELEFEGKTLTSEIYLWVRNNRFLKLRYTAPAAEAESNEADLKSLLTAFGDAEKAPIQPLRLKGPLRK